MKKKMVAKMVLIALGSCFVVMAGEAFLFQRPISVRAYVILFISMSASFLYMVLRSEQQK